MSSENYPLSLFPRPSSEASAFNPLDLQLAFSTPRLLSPTSAWIQHIPFACMLVELLRPKQIVELGVHAGDSYCAFCQAVDTLKLECKCTGVDNWLGDSQSGLYDESVFTTLQSHHDPLYLHFSRLLRTTFDDAIAEFPNNTIDLLHIDGVHDYDSVRHDFDRWLPKMSDAGVLLIHDTHVHAPDFGVHQLWKELCPLYPHFEFPHGYGLGVLLVGKNPPAPLVEFIAAANHSPARFRQFFTALGQRLEFARGLSLLSEDLRRQQLLANNWRSATRQPANTPSLQSVSVPQLLHAKPAEPKEIIDAAHETALNLLEELPAIAADNAHLRNTCESLRRQWDEAAVAHQFAQDAEFRRIVAELRLDNHRLRRDFGKVRRKIAILSLRRSLYRFLASLPGFHRILR